MSVPHTAFPSCVTHALTTTQSVPCVRVSACPYPNDLLCHCVRSHLLLGRVSPEGRASVQQPASGRHCWGSNTEGTSKVTTRIAIKGVKVALTLT